jgi:hypothetical protein
MRSGRLPSRNEAMRIAKTQPLESDEPIPQNRYSNAEKFHYEWPGAESGPAMLSSTTIIGEKPRVRSIRIAGGATQLVLAACAVASCAFPESLFRIGGAPAIQDRAVHVHSNTPSWQPSELAAARPGSGESDRVTSVAIKAGEPAHTSSPEGVGSKPLRPLTEIRKQLARLLKNGSMAIVPDERIDEGASARQDRYYVQIGSHQLQSAAESHWSGARFALSTIISSFDLRIRPTDLPNQGMFFRVQIGPIQSQGAALDLCRALKARQQACFTLAEKKSASETVADAKMNGGWASIEPSDGGKIRDTAALDIEQRTSIDARQVADAAPIYTVPRLPALPD